VVTGETVILHTCISEPNANTLKIYYDELLHK